MVTFGGFKEDFMLVLQEDETDNNSDMTNRHLFAMPPGRVSPFILFTVILSADILLLFAMLLGRVGFLFVMILNKKIFWTKISFKTDLNVYYTYLVLVNTQTKPL